MRLWRESYTKPALMLLASSGAFSVLVHTGLIASAIVATRRPPELPGEGIANRVFYMPPPDRAPSVGPAREVIHYIAVSPTGFGAGLASAVLDEPKAKLAEASPAPAEVVRDSVETKPAPVPQPVTHDSAFSVLEVDIAVVRSENSAAPAYPLSLLQKGITGSVAARYVVDTTGFADTSSFEVLRATHRDFVAAVRAALPYMRFSPAKIGSRRVRQLVEQEFTFRITTDLNAPKKPLPYVAAQVAR